MGGALCRHRQLRADRDCRGRYRHAAAGAVPAVQAAAAAAGLLADAGVRQLGQFRRAAGRDAGEGDGGRRRRGGGISRLDAGWWRWRRGDGDRHRHRSRAGASDSGDGGRGRYRAGRAGQWWQRRHVELWRLPFGDRRWRWRGWHRDTLRHRRRCGRHRLGARIVQGGAMGGDGIVVAGRGGDGGGPGRGRGASGPLPGLPATGFGGGGGGGGASIGAAPTSSPGGAGAPGIVIVEY